MVCTHRWVSRSKTVTVVADWAEGLLCIPAANVAMWSDVKIKSDIMAKCGKVWKSVAKSDNKHSACKWHTQMRRQKPSGDSCCRLSTRPPQHTAEQNPNKYKYKYLKGFGRPHFFFTFFITYFFGQEGQICHKNVMCIFFWPPPTQSFWKIPKSKILWGSFPQEE